ncbi:glioma pathogenesis-related protein 1 [Heterocephalus glaber]|uniref:Glioma pathogenesis-related protein 1 n=1 Tax=Heterocephalus glaber TaxID=10181 RepID=A0AAX6T2M6_HETGA|nr:glioma pathogenesis-related protein 1 [Heterocephalus glaber]
MWVTLLTMAWVISFVSSHSYTANTLPDIENEDFIKDCVRIHNKFRSEVNPTASDMLYMTWDPALAQVAKAWAKNCLFGHNPQLKSHRLHPNFDSLGENIWTGSLFLFSVSSAISNWYNEIQYYDFNTQKCNNVCGHYTQVVWADSYKVGCAVQFCPRVSGFDTLSNGAHFICNYGPPIHGTLQLQNNCNCKNKYISTNGVFCFTEEITQLGHIKEEPHAVPAPLMTRVWTISVLIHSETKSHVTTLLCIRAGPYIHVIDTHLSFLLLIHQLYYCLL